MTSQELFTNCQSAVSVGIVLMCAGEILMRTSMDTFERGGLKLNGEAKQCAHGLFDGVRKVSHYQQRLAEHIISKSENNTDAMQTFDNMLFNANKLAQIGMQYYTIYATDARPENADVAKLYNVIQNMAMKSTTPVFTQEYINQFEPKL